MDPIVTQTVSKETKWYQPMQHGAFFCTLGEKAKNYETLKLRNSNTLATCCEELTHLKRSWCLERLKAGEGDNRGWDGWMASLTLWTGVWVSSGSWWWTEKPGVLQSMGSQRDMTEQLNWTERAKQDSAPETPAEHVSVVRVANSHSMFTDSELTKG